MKCHLNKRRVSHKKTFKSHMVGSIVNTPLRSSMISTKVIRKTRTRIRILSRMLRVEWTKTKIKTRMRWNMVKVMRLS